MSLQTEKAPHVESHTKIFHLKVLTWLQIACKMHSYFKTNCNLAHQSWTHWNVETVLLAGFASYANIEISFWGGATLNWFLKANPKELQTTFSPNFSVISALSHFGMKVNVKDWNIKTLRWRFFFWWVLIYSYTKMLQSNTLSFWKPKWPVITFAKMKNYSDFMFILLCHNVWRLSEIL